MLIGELSQKTKLSRHTIRYYEKMGLISLSDNSRRNNNYKEYPEETLKQLKAVQHMKSQGFTLREARRILELVERDAIDPDRGKKYILKKVQGIEKKIYEMLRMRRTLIDVADKCGTDLCDVRQILFSKE